MASKPQDKNTAKLELFAARLKAAMSRRGAVLRNLSEVTGKGISTAGSWTQAKNWPEVESLEQIAAYLETSVDFLISGRPVISTAEVKREEISPSEIDSSPRSYEYPSPSGTAGSIRERLQKEFKELLEASGDDVERLGWISEQMRQHLAEPTHWGMPERVAQRVAERMARERAEKDKSAPERKAQ